MTLREFRLGLSPYGWGVVAFALPLFALFGPLVAVLVGVDWDAAFTWGVLAVLASVPFHFLARCYECGKSPLMFGEPRPRIGPFRLMAVSGWPEQVCSECGADLTITEEELDR